ncbi:MAG: pkb-activating kinase-like protein [Cirrosporium novae-zelandiae]|nr:MAG: pkb-activating kinase-like protein [Cirrosporium novae-zelandiae]
MDGDLSLSQSLGGLRIANPDNASPLSPLDSQVEDHIQSIPPITQQPPLTLDNPPSFANVSPQPSTLIPEPLPEYERAPIEPRNPSPSLHPTHSQKSKYRQSTPLTYHDHQQQQFPHYPAMMSQNQRPPGSSTRPASVMYTQPLSTSKSNSSLARSGSYRIRTESGRAAVSSMPRRSNSRSAETAFQAGVPSRDGSHSDRIYRHSQIPLGNGPAPPRQSSRMVASQSGMVGTPLPMAGNSYGAEVPKSHSEEWKERGAAVTVRHEIGPDGKPIIRSQKKGVKDFNFGRTLGEGSYSTVLAATDRQTLKEYAIKVLDKRHIIKERKVKYVNLEKDALNRLTDHPGVVRLYYTFQDERSLYFVLDLATGGELLGVLKRMGTFDEECTRFYGAQMLDTIEYMHKQGVIHRDLKPENVLLDSQMHVKITDFGTAKLLDPPKQLGDGGMLGTEDQERSNSFVGTAEYVSPELLADKNAGKPSDLWAFGCIIYQLLAGRPPFKAGNEYQTFQKIISLDYQFPRGFPEIARDLVERLLVLDPAKRLTIEHIKNHPFFEPCTSWGRQLWIQKAPRLKSYNPATAEGTQVHDRNGDSYPPNIAPAHSTHAAQIPPPGPSPNGIPRSAPRVITELPPPSQLDIEWSPVLTRNNERILRLGDLTVIAAPAPHSPDSKNGDGHDAPKKFSRFFGGNATKKRQRLVIVTSGGRIILAAAGGNEKKSKTEISLLTSDCSWRSTLDAKGGTNWCVDTREKHFVFEDSKSSANPEGNAVGVQEWMEALDRAKEVALQNNRSYSNDDFSNLSSTPSSHANTLNQDLDNQDGRGAHQKNHSGADSESIKGRKRFSKRQSKSGLAAVF